MQQRVHKGFYRVYASMADAVRRAVTAACGQVGQPEALFITGHSLGSSLATLAVPDVLENTIVDVNDMRVRQYNLASPRTGDTRFAARYNANGAPTYRIVNSTDLSGSAWSPAQAPPRYSAPAGSGDGPRRPAPCVRARAKPRGAGPDNAAVPSCHGCDKPAAPVTPRPLQTAA